MDRMRLVSLLSAALVALPAFASAQTASCPTLSLGSSGASVSALQQILFDAYDGFPSPTGYFGKLTQNALKQWQSEHGIEATGTVGPKTAAAMNLCTTSAAAKPAAPAAPGPIAAFYRSFGLGSLGADVMALQNVLVAAGYLAPENITGYFGQATQDALKKWQAAQGLVASGSPSTTGFGAVGPKTMKALNAVYVTSQTASISNVSRAGASCYFGDKTIPSGASANFFLSPYVEPQYACSVQTRTCLDGVLSGSNEYRYSSCVATSTITQLTTNPACVVPGLTMENGTSHTFYVAPVAPLGSTCAAISEVRTCTNGALDGDVAYSYRACQAAIGSSCLFAASGISDGATVIAFKDINVASGGQCVSEQRRCSNGTLSGSYQYATCTVGGALACTVGSVQIPSGTMQTFYSAPTVAYGSSCDSVAQARTCTLGSLSGSAAFSYPACSVRAPSCTFDGLTIESGNSVMAFASRSVSVGGSCGGLRRTCTNGALSGSASYAYSTCYASSNNASAPNAFITAVNGDTTIKLQSWFAAPSGTGPFPTLILQHGCNGVNPDDSNSAWSQMNQWASLFRGWGYATLIIDGFTARGYPSGICADSTLVSLASRTLDTYNAATVLAQMGPVSPRKIGVFGASQGGNTMEEAVNGANSTTATARAALESAGGGIAAGAALYPSCAGITTGHTFYAPYFLAIGAKDDWSSPEICEPLANYPAASSAPVDVAGYGSVFRLIVYPNATHGFDVNLPLRTYFGHVMQYDAAATVDVQSRIKTFFDTYLK